MFQAKKIHAAVTIPLGLAFPGFLLGVLLGGATTALAVDLCQTVPSTAQLQGGLITAARGAVPMRLGDGLERAALILSAQRGETPEERVVALRQLPRGLQRSLSIHSAEAFAAANRWDEAYALLLADTPEDELSEGLNRVLTLELTAAGLKAAGTHTDRKDKALARIPTLSVRAKTFAPATAIIEAALALGSLAGVSQEQAERLLDDALEFATGPADALAANMLVAGFYDDGAWLSDVMHEVQEEGEKNLPDPERLDPAQLADYFVRGRRAALGVTLDDMPKSIFDPKAPPATGLGAPEREQKALKALIADLSPADNSLPPEYRGQTRNQVLAQLGLPKEGFATAWQDADAEDTGLAVALARSFQLKQMERYCLGGNLLRQVLP